jgi:hypothetical protein
MSAYEMSEQHVRSGVEAEHVARTQAMAAEGSGEFAHQLLVGATDHDGAHTVFHDLFEGHDVAHRVRGTRIDHVEALVEGHLRTDLEQLEVDLGMHLHPHLAPAGQDVDRFVVVESDDHAVGVRRLGQLVDLVTQRTDVFACLTQGVAQLPFVSSRRSSRERTRVGVSASRERR